MSITEIFQQVRVGDKQLTNTTNDENTNLVLVEGGTQVDYVPLTPLEASGLFPLDNQVPDKIFGRKFCLESTIHPPGNVIRRFLYDDMFGPTSTTGLYEMVKKFAFVRSDLEVEILIEAPVTTFGYYVAYWYPYANSFPHPSIRSTYDWKDFVPLNSAYGSVSDNESISLTIPFQSYVPMLPVQDEGDATAFTNWLKDQGQLWIKYVAGDSLSTGADEEDVGFTIFCKAINPVLTGPVVAQSGIGETITAASNVYKMGMQGMQALIKGRDELCAAFPNTPMICKGSEPLDQGDVDKPSKGEGNTRQSVKQSLYGDTSTIGASQVSFQNLGDYVPKYPYSPHLIAVEPVPHDVYAMMRRWCFCKDGFYNKDGSVNMDTIRCHPDDDGAAGYTKYWRRHFRLWRGSFEYKFIFFSTSLVTSRIQILIIPPGANEPGPAASPDDVGNMLTYTATIRGTTEMTFTVPYLYHKAWQGPVKGDSKETWRVRLRVFPFSAMATTVSIPVLVLWRSGEDFLLSGYKSGSNPVAQGLFNGPEETANLPDGSGPASLAFQQKACTGNIYKLLQRASVRRGNFNSYTRPGLDIIGDVSWAEADNFDQIAMMFMFWSGSMNFKSHFSQPALGGDLITASASTWTESTPGYAVGDYRTSNGGQIIQQSVWPVSEVTMPYYCDYMATPTDIGTITSISGRYANPAFLYHSNSDNTLFPDQNVLVTPGDDFMFYMLLPPIPDDQLPVVTAA